MAHPMDLAVNGEPSLLEKLVECNIKRTLDAFAGEGAAGARPPPEFEPSRKVKIAAKMKAEYAFATAPGAEGAAAGPSGNGVSTTQVPTGPETEVTRIVKRVQDETDEKRRSLPAASGELVIFKNPSAAAGAAAAAAGDAPATSAGGTLVVAGAPSTALARQNVNRAPVPQWHRPWKLQSVVSGHLGWVRAIAFDPGNEWFATGSADRTIKIWDFAKCATGAEGGLKLTLTGHISTIRGLAVSPRHPYLFSAAEDKKVLCWDLETNKVIRHYHGHLSGIYALKLHPTLDILVTGGRDAVARVWDMRTKQQVHCLSGHTDAVGTLATNSVDPQVITGSFDSQVRLWDLTAGKCMAVLTNHKKAVRAVQMNAKEFSFVSAAADNMKRWQARDGMFLNNISGHNSIINALAANHENVLVSGGDNGSICMWDYATGYMFQRLETIVQPGSMDAEAGIFATCFDESGLRLVTGEADKTIKIWREDLTATPDSHPIDMKRWVKDFRNRKR